MQTLKDILLIIQAISGIGFSIYVMYAMYRTEKGIRTVAKEVIKFGEAVPTILQTLNKQDEIIPADEEDDSDIYIAEPKRETPKE